MSMVFWDEVEKFWQQLDIGLGFERQNISIVAESLILWAG